LEPTAHCIKSHLLYSLKLAEAKNLKAALEGAKVQIHLAAAVLDARLNSLCHQNGIEAATKDSEIILRFGNYVLTGLSCATLIMERGDPKTAPVFAGQRSAAIRGWPCPALKVNRSRSRGSCIA
jgi:hypothetical protein